MILTDAAQNALTPWHPYDGENLLRCGYVTGQVISFLRSEDGGVRDRHDALTAKQQLIGKMSAFASGHGIHRLGGMDEMHPAFRKLKPDAPERDCVWEMRTTDVRLFGWFPGPPNTWIGVKAILKRDLLDANGSESEEAYRDCIADVVAWRRDHGMAGAIWRMMADDLPIHLRC